MKVEAAEWVAEAPQIPLQVRVACEGGHQVHAGQYNQHAGDSAEAYAHAAAGM